MSFNDIHEIIYEPELATRGKVTLELKTSMVRVIYMHSCVYIMYYIADSYTYSTVGNLSTYINTY